jgi:hypothetical protein
LEVGKLDGIAVGSTKGLLVGLEVDRVEEGASEGSWEGTSKGLIVGFRNIEGATVCLDAEGRSVGVRDGTVDKGIIPEVPLPLLPFPPFPPLSPFPDEQVGLADTIGCV